MNGPNSKFDQTLHMVVLCIWSYSAKGLKLCTGYKLNLHFWVLINHLKIIANSYIEIFLLNRKVKKIKQNNCKLAIYRPIWQHWKSECPVFYSTFEKEKSVLVFSALNFFSHNETVITPCPRGLHICSIYRFNCLYL